MMRRHKHFEVGEIVRLLDRRDMRKGQVGTVVPGNHGSARTLVQFKDGSLGLYYPSYLRRVPLTKVVKTALAA